MPIPGAARTLLVVGRLVGFAAAAFAMALMAKPGYEGFRYVFFSGSLSFKPLLKEAGLPDIRFHDLRHTCATTLLLSRGHHPKLVQDLLGHASVALTLDRYSHVLPGMGDQTAKAMEAALS